MPSINNPATVTPPTSRGPRLHPHQQELLAKIVAAYQEDHRDFEVRGSGRITIKHPGLNGITRVQHGDIVALQREHMIDVVRANDDGTTREFAPTALASAFVHPDDYVDLSHEAWAISKDTLRNRPERIRDVQRILRGICDDSEHPDAIRDTARAADLLLGQVERYLDTGNPADEPLARASTASLRVLALTILRIGGPEVLGAAVEAFREVLELLDA